MPGQQASGFGLGGLGFTVHGLGFRVEGFRVLGLGFLGLELGFQQSGGSCKILNPKLGEG